MIFSQRNNLSFFSALSSLKAIKLFIAKTIARDIPKWKTLISIEASFFNKINFIQSIEIITLLIPLLTYSLQEDLCSIIKLSSKSNSINLAASNSIFILKRSEYKFRDLDFRNISIPGADLSESLFVNVDFSGSCLKKVNFSQSKLYNCNFKNCDFSDALFSNFKTVFKHDKVIKKFIVSQSGKFLLICSYSDTTLWDFNLKIQLFSSTFVCESAVFSSNENLIVCTDGFKKNFITWDRKLIEFNSNFIENTDWTHRILDITISSCGKFVAFFGKSFIEIYEAENLYNYKKWNIYCESSILFTKCGRFIVFGDKFWLKMISIEDGKVCGLVKLNCAGKIAFSPSYKYLSLSGEFLFIINFETKELIFKEDWNRKTFYSLVCWSPNEDKMVFSNWSGLQLFDIEKQIIIAQIRENFSLTRSISYSNDSKYVMIDNGDKLLELWDLESQKAQKRIELIENYVIAVAFSRCEKYVYSVTQEFTIEKCDIIRKSSEMIIKDYKGRKIACASFSSCRTYCALGINDKSIELWDLDIKNRFIIFIDNFEYISSLVFSPSGKYLFSSHRFSIIIWNIEQKKSIATIECDANKLAFSPNEKYFASSHNEIVLVWKNDRSYNMINHLKHDHHSLVLALTFSACNQFLFIGNNKGQISIWNYFKKEKIKEIIFDNKISAWYLSITPIGLVAGMNTQIVLINDKTYEIINEIDVKLQDVRKFAMTKSGEWTAFGGLHSTVKMRRLAK